MLPVSQPPASWLAQLPEAQRPSKDAKLAAVVAVGPLAPITSVRFSPDGRWLLSASDDRVVVWDAKTGATAGQLPGIDGMVHALAFSPDGKWLAVGGGAPTVGGRVWLYDGSALMRPPAASITGHHDVVYGLAFSPDGKQLATASLDRTAEVWHLATRKSIATLTGHSDALDAVAFAPDGRVLTGSMDHAARLWNVKTARTDRAFSGTRSGILAIQVAPDNKRLVTADQDGEIRWWNIADAKPVRTSGGHHGEVNDLAFNRAGNLLASAGADGTVRLWDGTSGEERATFSCSTTPLNAVDFSPGGDLLATGGWDGILRLWDAKSKKPRISLIAAPPVDRSSGTPAPGSATRVGPPGAPAAHMAKSARGQTTLSRAPRRSKSGFNPVLRTRSAKPGPVSPGWLAVTPDGCYDGSGEMLRRIKFEVGSAEVPERAGIEAALHKPAQVARTLAP